MVIITKLLNRYVYTTEINSLIPGLRGMPMMIMMSFYIRQRIHGQTRVSSIRISIQNRTRVPLLVVLGLVIFFFTPVLSYFRFLERRFGLTTELR